MMSMRPDEPSKYHSLDDPSTQGIQNPLMGGKITEETFKVCMPSEILLLTGIAEFETTKNDDVFCDLYSDIVDKCSEYG
eukprot:CAMPEP_0176344970 /NCGR_PEP_ID=MMETSP0126-20121128/5101_1 /TAXON_ID=141414 ORGANISM="Strombidinopsis acuminatum, Strain SPMC142" /NCGR_SAMPLE_ID=MMETSP0126 /ASSEMBLY_ACC=CAM_ASM_000229 /LENGTH=78 /DNA_ID=CAMNT_0017691701 /DNA_START=262 /DNA_END=498 /DNA_ORIENTATION=+